MKLYLFSILYGISKIADFKHKLSLKEYFVNIKFSNGIELSNLYGLSGISSILYFLVLFFSLLYGFYSLIINNEDLFHSFNISAYMILFSFIIYFSIRKKLIPIR